MRFANSSLQEMSQLLGQQISNADEEAVLEEYERLQREVVYPELLTRTTTDGHLEPYTTSRARHDTHSRCSFSRGPGSRRPSGNAGGGGGDTKGPCCLSVDNESDDHERSMSLLIQSFYLHLALSGSAIGPRNLRHCSRMTKLMLLIRADLSSEIPAPLYICRGFSLKFFVCERTFFCCTALRVSSG